ncbi:MAG: hypothetical protein ABFD60_01430 [Bryobacteraceae bacterium]
MNEADIKGALMKRIREEFPGFVAMRHEDRLTAGVPDISLTGHRRTSWWEVKVERPDRPFESSAVQQRTMVRLARAGHACYIVYEFRADGTRCTHTVLPDDIGDWRNHSVHIEGFNHNIVLEAIRVIHK